MPTGSHKGKLAFRRKLTQYIIAITRGTKGAICMLSKTRSIASLATPLQR